MNGDFLIDGRDLDPFSYFPGLKSRIGGLPGSIPSHEPAYVFHTLYVCAEPGLRRFFVRFAGLEASSGTLLLRVHLMPINGPGQAKLLNSARVLLADLARQGGNAEIAFQGYSGGTVALYGSVPDGTDAVASGVTILLDGASEWQDDEPAGAETMLPAPPSHVAVAAITSRDAPSLQVAVSQPWTPQQENEPAFRAASAILAGALPSGTEMWAGAYLLGVLTSYGLLRPGCHALALGRTVEPLVTHLVARGMSVAQAEGDPADPLPGAGVALDRYEVVWTWNILQERATARAAFELMLKLLTRMAPGSMVIHLFAAWPGGRAAAGGDRISAASIEQWALTLVAHGHEVAQVKLPRVANPLHGGPVPYGMIVRRGSLIG